MKMSQSTCRKKSALVLFVLAIPLPFALAAQTPDAANQLTIYPVTNGLPQSGDFTVRVRTPGHPWQELPVYVVKVAQGIDLRPAVRPVTPNSPGTRTTTQNSSMACFDFSGAVDVSITLNRRSVDSVRVRPLSYGITPQIKDNVLSFSLKQPRNISVEVNGDIFHNLQLFANPLEVSRPTPDDPNVIYFGPGVHQVGRLTIPSGKTVYLAGGSLVDGSFLISHAENVRVLGRGILHQSSVASMGVPKSDQPGTQASTRQSSSASSRQDGILIEYSRDVEVNGIIELPSSYSVLIGQSENVSIRNIKSFSAGGNNDGIDVFTSTHVLIDGVFMRNSDDNIAIYGHRWNYYGDVRHVIVQNSTLWADVAHPILVGTHGDSANPDTLEDLEFRNIDILDHREPQLDYQGCMSLNAGDSNKIRDVRFEDIRVEDFNEGQLLNLRVFFNRKYNTSPGNGIEDVLFRNVTYTGTHANPSMIEGYDENRAIKNVVFENLRINERLIFDDMPGKPGYYKTADMANIFVGEHADGIRFIADDEQKLPAQGR